MKKWEYKRYNRRLSDQELADLGDEGWEMVSHAILKETSILGQGSEYYMFKRSKEQVIKS